MLAPFGFGVAYLVFPVILLLFLLLEGVSALLDRRHFRRTLPLPIESIDAEVLRRWVSPGCGHHFSADRQLRVSFARHYARLALASGGETTFLLTRAQYNALQAGMRGVLTRRGSCFLDFAQQ